MARHRRPNTADDRRQLLAAAAAVLGVAADAVILVAGAVEIVRPEPQPVRPGRLPEGMSAYDAAILGALADRPLSAQQIAHRSGHRHNSYFRGRLAALVEAGHVRQTRRGYSLGGPGR